MDDCRIFLRLIFWGVMSCLALIAIIHIFDIETPGKRKERLKDTLYNQCIADGVKEYECYSFIYKRGR